MVSTKHKCFYLMTVCVMKMKLHFQTRKWYWNEQNFIIGLNWFETAGEASIKLVLRHVMLRYVTIHNSVM